MKQFDEFIETLNEAEDVETLDTDEIIDELESGEETPDAEKNDVDSMEADELIGELEGEETPTEETPAEDLTPETTPEEVPAPDVPAVAESTETQKDPIYAEIWQKYSRLDNLPIVEKIDILISMIKEFGYANVNYKITDEKNSLEVKGRMGDVDKEEVRKLCKDLAFTVNIKDVSLSENRHITIIAFDNIIDSTKFKDVFKRMKAEEIKKKIASEGGGGFGGGSFGSPSGGLGEVTPTEAVPTEEGGIPPTEEPII